MTVSADLIEAIARNYAAAFSVIARNVEPPGPGARRFGDVTAIATGLESSFFNPVLALADATALQDVLDAHAWVKELGHGVSVHVRTDLVNAGLLGALEERGLEREETPEPAMVLSPIPQPPAAPRDLRLVEVSAAELEAWQRSIAGSDEAFSRVSRLFAPPLLDDADVRLHAGFVGERLVTTSFAVRSGDVVGIYAVGTEPSVRRRGFGTAVTWAALASGRAWGCTTGVLQASAMGVRVYRAMGFRQVTSYTLFLPPPPDPAVG